MSIFPKNMKIRLKKAQAQYTLALSAHEAAMEIGHKASLSVLNSTVFTNEETGERITNPKRDFLMGDSDFDRYVELTNKEMRKLGHVVPLGNTATHETWPALKQAEDELISIAIAITPASVRGGLERARNHYKYRGELVDLTYRLAL